VRADVCNLFDHPRAVAGNLRRRHAAVTLIAAGASLALSCAAPPPTIRRISLASLEAAPPRYAVQRMRTVVGDIERLGSLYRPLTDRVGIIEVRDRRAWDRLHEVAPRLGPPPDFARGMVVGVVSRAGQRVDGRWPIRIESVRLSESAGLVTSSFESGAYLPDGVAFMEATFVEGLAAVLVVEVDGMRFYAD
jgi:hypothetical protein